MCAGVSTIESRKRERAKQGKQQQLNEVTKLNNDQ